MAAPIPRSAEGEVVAAPIRVIQWATGSIGTHAIPAILEDPGLELVGVKVYSEAKDGKDAGTLVGIDPIGLTATRDVDALLALEADCVLYAPLLADVGEICRLLEAGLNVITPAGWAYLKDGAEKRTPRQGLRASAGVSFHGYGHPPGLQRRPPARRAVGTLAAASIKRARDRGLQHGGHEREPRDGDGPARLRPARGRRRARTRRRCST